MAATLDILILTAQKHLEANYDEALREQQVTPVWVCELVGALHENKHRLFNAIVVDFDVTSFNVEEACAALGAANDRLPILALATSATEDFALSLVGTTVDDLVLMPAHPRLFAERVRQSSQLTCLLHELRALGQTANSLMPKRMANQDLSPLSPPFVIRSNTEEAFPSMEEIERKYTQYVLACVGGNRSQAARILGLSRKTLWRKLRGQQH